VKIDPPEPGIYPGTPMDVYLSWRAASNTGLGKILRSPAHMVAADEEPFAESDAFRLGRGFHQCILEPDRFKAGFSAEPDLSKEPFASMAKPRSGKVYKEAVARMQVAGKTVLKTEEMVDLVAMREAAFGHPKLKKVIEATGAAELSIVWDDPATGVRCKARIDWHTPTYGGGACLDLKSTLDASPGAFERAIFNFGYHRQGALYVRGAKAVGLETSHFVIGAIEKKRPYGAVLYRLKDGEREALRLGEVEIDFALALWARCEAEGKWPGYTTDVVDIGLPPWADAKIERSLEEIAI
jgi:hypothetical protein